MKKLLTVLLCFSLFALSASVSFASDGTETTKDCVVDNLDVMETSIVADEVVKSYTDVYVIQTNCINCYVERTSSTANIDVEIYARLIDNRNNILEDYGVRRSNNFITDKPIKPNSVAYTYQSNDNKIRKLIFS